jgi:Arc/MetJ-type ribon-helix-helix transcriptional regulator
MARQDKSLAKKRGRPTGVTHGDFIGLRLPSSLAASLDTWIGEQAEPRPSRSEAIRRLLAKALSREAAARPAIADEAALPEIPTKSDAEPYDGSPI